MATQKRPYDTADPDYTDTGELQIKKQRVAEQDAKEAVAMRIKGIIQTEFEKEINDKERELHTVDQQLNKARMMMDRLRACIVANYYGQTKSSISGSSLSQLSSLNAPPPSIHPAIKKHIGKCVSGYPHLLEDDNPVGKIDQSEQKDISTLTKPVLSPSTSQQSSPSLSHCSSPWQTTVPPPPIPSTSSASFEDRRSRLKIKRKVIVGNVSKYIPVDEREANDMSSHKWMVYVRGPKSSPDISPFVSRVWFFLHHSYKPNDLVEVSSPPFHLTRRGWGEFPVRVQLHFVDPRNKNIDIIHHLKLDKTFTGLQSLGAETVVEVELDRHFFESSSLAKSCNSDPLEKSENSRSSTPSLTEAPPACSHSAEVERKVLQESTQLPLEIKCENQESQQFLINLKPDPDPSSSCKSLETLEDYNVTISHESKKEVEDSEVDVCDIALNASSHVKPNVKSPNSFSKCVIATNSQTKCLTNLKPFPNLLKTSSICSNVDVNSVKTSNDFSNNREHPKQSSLLLQKLQKPSSVKTNQEHNPVLEEQQEISVATNKEVESFQEKHETLPLQVKTQPTVIHSVQTVAPNFPSCLPSATRTPGKHLMTVVNPSCIRNKLPSIQAPSTVISTSKSSMSSLLGKNIVIQTAQQTPKLSTQTHSAKVLSSSLSSSSIISQPLKTDDGCRKIVVMPTQSPKVISLRDNRGVSPQISLQQKPAPPSIPKGKQVSLLTGKIISPQQSILPGNSSPNAAIKHVKVPLPSFNGLPMSHTPAQIVTPGQLQCSSDKGLNVSMIQQQGKQFLVLGSGNSPGVLSAKNTQSSVLKSNSSSLLNVNKVNISSLPNSSQNQQTASLSSLLNGSSSNSSVSDSLDRLQTSGFEKMSAVGNTKFGKGYRSQNNMNNIPILKTDEERRQGQYDILNAWKMNPEKFAKVKSQMSNVRSNDRINGEVEDVPLLRLTDFSDLQSLTRAALKLHPLIKPGVNRLTHPYCAESQEHWNSWHVGKQRACEWHRACFTIKYLKRCLSGQTSFHGNDLMSTRQLVLWSRRHGLSPSCHKKVSLNELWEEEKSSTQLTFDQWLQGQQVMTQLSQVENLLQSSADITNGTKDLEDLVDVLEDASPIRSCSSQKRVFSDVNNQMETISPSQGGHFVMEFLRRRGVKLKPMELEPGVASYVAADMLYQVAMEFTSDLLRETAGAIAGRSSLDMSVGDIHSALTSLPAASFVSTSCLGKEVDNPGLR